jgi:hypothetical protein
MADKKCAVCAEPVGRDEMLDVMGAEGVRKFLAGEGCDACGYGTRANYLFDGPGSLALDDATGTA